MWNKLFSRKPSTVKKTVTVAKAPVWPVEAEKARVYVRQAFRVKGGMQILIGIHVLQRQAFTATPEFSVVGTNLVVFQETLERQVKKGNLTVIRSWSKK